MGRDVRLALIGRSRPRPVRVLGRLLIGSQIGHPHLVRFKRMPVLVFINWSDVSKYRLCRFVDDRVVLPVFRGCQPLDV